MLLSIVSLTACTQASSKDADTDSKNEIGNPYVGWKEGELDIHHIYTGRGEANFHVFPDGTTMLIDAGDWDPSDYDKMCDPLPNASKRAGEWIARYIERVNPNKNEVDYLLISHFHSDHTGDCTNDARLTSGRNPNYVLTGVAEVGETISFNRLIDRGWPNYTYPLPIDDADVDNYHAFVKWKMESEGLMPEILDIGSSNQITLLRNKEPYAHLFTVQNLASSGRVWTGEGNKTIDYYNLHPDNLSQWQNENTKSIAIKISFGPFSYFTAGDLSGNLLDEDGNTVDIEEAVAKVSGKVDVCKANHHAYKDAMTQGFLHHIDASAYIIPVWDYEHIQPAVMQRMALQSSANEDASIFPTQYPTHLRERYADEPWTSSVSEQDGHVVVKVLNNGQAYKIYVLSAHDEQMIVSNVYGPYKTK